MSIQPINATNAVLKEQLTDTLCHRGGTQSMDFNEIKTPGSYLITKAQSMLNAPPGITSTYGDLIVYPGYYPIQEFHPSTASNVYFRRIGTESAWRAWAKFTGDMLT